jgi:IS30 family transposase
MATTLKKAVARAFRDIPTEMRNTLTLDDGKAFCGHKALAKTLGCPIYFAHPSCSWKRGLNEYLNGLIRQYFPEKSSFEHIVQR